MPPKFDPAKAKKLGVPSGPLFGKLTKGESIVLPNGQTINPSDCLLGDATPGVVRL